MHEEIHELKKEEQKSHDSDNDDGIFGFILLVIGLGFLFANLFSFQFNNWWALFILIPALFGLGNAFREFRRAGYMTPDSADNLGGGLFMTFIAAAFLFGLSWSLLWPIGLILLGLGCLAHAKYG